jgi:hypothetical protein
MPLFAIDTMISLCLFAFIKYDFFVCGDCNHHLIRLQKLHSEVTESVKFGIIGKVYYCLGSYCHSGSFCLLESCLGN